MESVLGKTCNFVRVIASRVSRMVDMDNDDSPVDSYIGMKERYDKYCLCIEDTPQFQMSYDNFRARIPKYEDFLKKNLITTQMEKRHSSSSPLAKQL